MLAAESTFPFAGSFALLRDPRLAPEEQKLELVRIIELGTTEALVSLPLRIGAEGNLRVPLADLIDGTPLTRDDEAELLSLDYLVRHKARRWKHHKHKHDALRQRQIHAICLRSEKAKWAAAQLEQRRLGMAA
jgi:hypothetical protein